MPSAPPALARWFCSYSEDLRHERFGARFGEVKRPVNSPRTGLLLHLRPAPDAICSLSAALTDPSAHGVSMPAAASLICASQNLPQLHASTDRRLRIATSRPMSYSAMSVLGGLESGE
jgi:hypothetical protein